MKNDYLWDKTGSDPEITKLENALSVFRQKDLSPPEIGIPSTIADGRAKRPFHKLFSFGVVSFAGLTAVVFGLSIFVMIRSGNVEMVNTDLPPGVETTESISAAEVSPMPEVGSGSTMAEAPSADANKVVFASRKPAAHRKSRSRTLKNQVRHLAAENNVRLKPGVKSKVVLTEEEKYAVEQLMLGLSITSSNLKMVKDKANGIRENEISK
ncbi:MAG: hypothetical protein R2681_13960 [Pyrinomonadaceae bacterium]